MHSDLDALASHLDQLPCEWAFCGGWAIDLFVGRQTRSRKDVDVAVFRDGQEGVQEYLLRRGWSLEIAHEGVLTTWQPGRTLAPPLHCIWCRREGGRPAFFEVLLNEREGKEFVFRRDSGMRLALHEALLRSESGLPILAPEVVCLYKSSDQTSKGNAADFRAVLPHLDAGRRRWLSRGLRRSEPTHAWLAAIGADRRGQVPPD